MVHVLRQIHKTLRPRGVLLDLHPLPEHPPAEVWREGHRIRLGILDDTVGIERTRAARARLQAVVRTGLFRVEARRRYHQFVHYPSVDAWLQRRKERGSTAQIPHGLLRRARREMQKPDSTLVLIRRIRVTTLRPLRGG